MDNKYHGGACKECGGTLRYIANGNCVPCKIKNNRERRLGKLKRTKFIDGMLCKKCNSTKKYESNGSCVSCAKEHSKKQGLINKKPKY